MTFSQLRISLGEHSFIIGCAFGDINMHTMTYSGSMYTSTAVLAWVVCLHVHTQVAIGAGGTV